MRILNSIDLNVSKWILGIMLVVSFSSCYSTKPYQYFPDLDDSTIAQIKRIPITDSSFSFEFQPYDQVNVSVISADPTLVAPFNIKNASSIGGYSGDNGGADMRSASMSVSLPVSGFTVDNEGFINYPLLGKIFLTGKTVYWLRDTLTKVIRSKYVRDAVVDVAPGNLSASVYGNLGGNTVNAIAGVTGRRVNISAKTSILELVNRAGGFGYFTDRKNVILIRQEGGVQHLFHIDCSDSKVFMDPHFYIRQNDIVYLRPTKARGFLSDPYTFRIASYISGMLGAIAIIYAILK